MAITERKRLFISVLLAAVGGCVIGLSIIKGEDLWEKHTKYQIRGDKLTDSASYRWRKADPFPNELAFAHRISDSSELLTALPETKDYMTAEQLLQLSALYARVANEAEKMERSKFKPHERILQSYPLSAPPKKQ